MRAQDRVCRPAYLWDWWCGECKHSSFPWISLRTWSCVAFNEQLSSRRPSHMVCPQWRTRTTHWLYSIAQFIFAQHAPSLVWLRRWTWEMLEMIILELVYSSPGMTLFTIWKTPRIARPSIALIVPRSACRRPLDFWTKFNPGHGRATFKRTSPTSIKRSLETLSVHASLLTANPRSPTSQMRLGPLDQKS